MATLPITDINHKFMVSGHSFLPNDQDFGVIEKKRINASHIYVLSEWMDLFAGANRKNPFEVVRMTTYDFLNSDRLADLVVNRKKCTDGGDVRWLKIQWICLKKETPLKFLKYSDEDDPFFELERSRKTRDGA